MNTKLIFWILGVLLGAILIGVLWYLFFFPKPTTQVLQQPPVTLPSSGSVTPVTPGSASSSPTAQTMTLTVQDDQKVITNDFIHNKITIPDAANAGRYLLAGNLGYCVSDPEKCQAGLVTHYNLYYNSPEQSFTIELTKEPIGQTRLAMEQFMLATLGISQTEMCSLNYYVGVTLNVNSQFTGKNLGFSFCPGATVLPK